MILQRPNFRLYFGKIQHYNNFTTKFPPCTLMPIESVCLIGSVTWCLRLVYGRLDARTIDKAFGARTHAISSLTNRFSRKRRYVRAIRCLATRDMRVCNRIGRFRKVAKHLRIIILPRRLSRSIYHDYLWSSTFCQLLSRPLSGTC